MLVTSSSTFEEEEDLMAFDTCHMAPCLTPLGPAQLCCDGGGGNGQGCALGPACVVLGHLVMDKGLCWVFCPTGSGLPLRWQ